MYEMNPNTRRDRDYEEEDDYRYDYRRGRDNYRDNYRGNYRRGRRNYRNYREEDYYSELEECMQEIKEYSRELEDLADMAENSQDRNMLMKIAQREKEHYSNLKQMLEK